MDAAQQLSIARQLSQKSRELKDVGDSMLHWENSMKLGDLKRRAYNEQIDKRQTPPKDSSENGSRFEMHKGEGNKFYKTENYAEAIVWYNKAMAEASSQAEISILYSNRAMCQLKMQQYEDALHSCDKAIELDVTNQKALYRRIQAHQGLNNNALALQAGEQLLKQYPRNVEGLKLVEKLKKATIKRAYVSTLDGVGVDVSFIDKPPHLQSRAALRRIPVRAAALPIPALPVAASVTIDGDKTPNDYKTTIWNDDMDLGSSTDTASSVDMSFIEKADLSPEKIDNPLLDSAKSSMAFQKSNKELENTAIKSDQQVLCLPKTSAEFYREWKSKGSEEARFTYLRLIAASDLNKFVGSQLDSNILSELLQVLAVQFVDNDIPPIDYLLELSKNKEMGVLALMMSEQDRQALESIIAYTNRRHEHTLKQISNTFSI